MRVRHWKVLAYRCSGPPLLKFGTEELRQQHLPPIARGEIRWAQGYSEPNAGSDLASLQMRADDMGDHFIVNGSKVWTSYGDLGDWMFCLVRTDFAAKKHEGISFVMFDMTTEGVSTRPIKLISGKSPFTETFLENVRVEKRPGDRKDQRRLDHCQVPADPRT